jgi:glycosyltransferase involved in cell wall biosynthesis
LGHRRRLAVVDTHFPWKISGFRYFEAKAILDLQPDTMFFALYRCTDPFPAEVHPLADFPLVAPAGGVTDIYMVFLHLASGILGIEGTPGLSGTVGARGDISLQSVLSRYHIRAHSMIYPGGGWTPQCNPDVIAEVGRRSTTTFSNIPGIDKTIPDVVPVVCPVPADLYALRERSAVRGEELKLVFVGDDQPRKGLATVLDAYELLDAGFRLTVVGPHERHADRVTSRGITTYGWLSPEDLRDVVSEADVVISPATFDLPEDGYGETGLADGFPATAAAVAMLSGCCMVGSNPLRDHVLLKPDKDYIEIPERNPFALADALKRLRGAPDLRRKIAAHGAATLRSRADAHVVARFKLKRMGF